MNSFHSRYLIDKGGNVNVLNNIGHSPLYHAASRGDVKFLNLILKAGCNLSMECWIRFQRFPIAITENQPLRDYLLTSVSNPLTLQTCAVNRIRATLQKEYSRKAMSLPIPAALQDVVSLRNLTSDLMLLV